MQKFYDRKEPKLIILQLNNLAFYAALLTLFPFMYTILLIIQ